MISLRTILFFALGVILLSWFFLRDIDTITNYPCTGTSIVAFGDSLVSGVGATQNHNFVSTLSKRTGYKIINLGVSGDTTHDGVARLDMLLQEDPRIVIVLLGGNDTLRHLPKEETEANLRIIIERLQRAGAGVLLVGVSGGMYYSQSYPEMFETLTDEYGVAFVPNILHDLLGDARYMSDIIHPNNAGHAIIADRIEPELKKLLTGTPKNQNCPRGDQ